MEVWSRLLHELDHELEPKSEEGLKIYFEES